MRNVYANTKYGRESLSPEMKSFIHWAKTGEVERKAALTGGVDANGGYLVPEEFSNEVVRKMKNIVVVRSAGARVLTIGSDKINVPVVSSEGAGGWMAATTQGSAYTQSEPTFSEVELTPHKYNRIALVSYEMLEDSFLNVADLLADIFAEDFASAEDKAFIAGTGTGQPEGMDTNANVVSVGLGTTFALTAADIFNIVYSLPRKYRNGACWFIHDAVVAKIRQFEDGSGQYIWTEGNLVNGEPPRLAGYPVYTSDALLKTDVDGGAAGNQPGSNLIFGNPRYYYIADRQGFRLQRSTERYFDTGQVAFRADKRVDGKIALAEAFVKSAPVKH
jgi:HK97 family phage major capsid protein